MAGENEVCVLHGPLQQEVSALNKDIGKVAAQVGKIEENTKQIPQMADDIKTLREQRMISKGFLAGVCLVITALASVGASLINAWLVKGGH